MLTELNDESVIELLSTFSCPPNLDVQNFLTDPNKGIRFEKSANARTYLILSDPGGDILAYFSITFKELILDEADISKAEIKRMDGISKKAERVRSFLIGQLGKNFSVTDNPLTLEDILSEIYSVISQARELVGGRIIILECEDSEKLIRLYQQHGFTLIETENGDLPELRTMYTHIQDTPER